MAAPTVAAIGEVMVEFSPAAGGENAADYQLGFAGDTFNTAVTLARTGIAVTYVTLLGDDPLSDRIVDMMARENIDAGQVVRLPGCRPGVYVIANDPSGERSFSYWRGESPARQLWSHQPSTRQFEQALRGFDCIYLSGITLAIITADARERLLAFLRDYRRAGGRVAFDSNFRPALWSSREEAKAAVNQFIAGTDIALLTMEDEQQLRGDLLPSAVIEALKQQALQEVVIKQGDKPVVVLRGQDMKEFPVAPVNGIVDTTGAGDAFNAGYLGARLRDESPEKAVERGNRAAAAVIRKRGGIVPKDDFLQAMGENHR